MWCPTLVDDNFNGLRLTKKVSVTGDDMKLPFLSGMSDTVTEMLFLLMRESNSSILTSSWLSRPTKLKFRLVSAT